MATSDDEAVAVRLSIRDSVDRSHDDTTGGIPSMAAKNHQPGASSGLRLGTILGAPVILAWSWFLAAIVITILFTPWLNQVRQIGRAHV